MAVQEINSRVFYIKGEATLEIALRDNGTSIAVENARCLYMVRLELAPEGHPELRGREFDVSVVTTHDGITYQKGLGGGRRGWVGDPIPFEKLVESARFPNERAKQQANPFLREALDLLFEGYHYNGNAAIYSEFEGYRHGLGDSFDEGMTYAPILTQAGREIVGHL